MSRFAEQIYAFRDQLRLSQRGFAERLSQHLDGGRALQASTVSRWESGAGLPRYEQIKAIYALAEAEGIDPKVFPIVRAEDLSELKEICVEREFEDGVVFSVTTPNVAGAMASILRRMADAGVDLQLVQGRVDEETGRAQIDLAFDGAKVDVHRLVKAINTPDLVDRFAFRRVRSPVAAVV